MTRLFMTGAESGSTAVFTSVANCTASTTCKRTGAYAYYLSPAGTSKASITLSAAISELYLRMGVYPTGFGASAGVVVSFASGTPKTQGVLIINDLTYLLEYCLGNTIPVLTGTHPITMNSWCCIEIYYKVANALGRFVVKVDGVTDIDFTGDTQNVDATIRAVTFGYESITRGISGYLDDLAINDTAGAVNNTWIGRGGIYGIVPEGVGNYTDLHASAGNAWDCINEVPPDNTDYVYDDTVDQKSTYALTALVPTTGTIDCINVIMRANLDAAGTGNIARLIRSNGTDGQGADVGLDASAKTIQEIIETDPSGGAAWTVARVNALEAGAVVR